MLAARLKEDSVSVSMIERISGLLARFHREAVTNSEIRLFGAPQQVRSHLEENFDQTKEFLNGVLPPSHYQTIQDYSWKFLEENNHLFLRRMQTDRIRDCHGDLRIQNICISPFHEEGIQIFDCIEFNDRFRYIDVAADLAYLAMDLDLSGRSDLRKALIDSYVKESEDQELRILLPFYQCYRAYVQGKINLLASVEKEIPESQRGKHLNLAAAAFDLALSYSKVHPRPTLLITTGISGSGKSVLARELARRIPAVIFSSDSIRKELAGASGDQPVPSRWYRPEKVAMVYGELRNRATDYLKQGENVILDATFLSSQERQAAELLASQCNARFQIVDCRVRETVARARIEERAKLDRDYSDATPAVLQDQLSKYKEPEENTIQVNTEDPPGILARSLLNQI
jgi:predicted kinase